MTLGGNLKYNRAAWIEYGTVAGLCAGAAGSITYVGLAGFNPDDPAIHDNREYAAMYEGSDEVQKPFHWRILVPALARLIPGSFEVSFGVINIFALTVAGVALYCLLRRWGAEQRTSLIGLALFYLSHTVLRFGGIPLVESSAYAVIILAMLAAAYSQRVLFALAVFIGMFVKETTAVMMLFPLLMAGSAKSRLIFALMALPGIAAYAIVRFVIDPVGFGYEYSATAWLTNLTAVVTPAGFDAWRGIVLSFGFLWVFVFLGIMRGGLLEKRYAWFIAACCAAPVFLTTDYERVIFLSFPVALAFALPHLERALGLVRPTDGALHKEQGATVVHESHRA